MSIDLNSLPDSDKTHPVRLDFRHLFESVPGLLLVLLPDDDFTIAAMSDAYSIRSMVRREDAIGQGLFTVFPDDPDDINATGSTNLRSSLKQVLEYRKADPMPLQKYNIRRPDGTFEPGYWSIVNSPVLDNLGNVLYIINKVEDVTEYVKLKNRQQSSFPLLDSKVARAEAEIYLQAQEVQKVNEALKNKSTNLLHIRDDLVRQLYERNLELERSSERTQLALDAGTLGEWDLDLITGHAYRSLRHDMCFGYQEALPEWTFDIFLSHVHPDDRNVVSEQFKDALARQTIWNLECRVIWPDGSVHWIAARGKANYDQTGSPIRMSGIVSDITDQILSRKALEQSKIAVENERENFRNLFRQTPEMVCILSGPEHVFEFVNEAHIKAIAFDATGMSVREAQPESIEVHGILDEVFASGKTAELREIPVTVGTKIRYFNLTFAPRRDLTGTVDGIMILGSEITEQVEARKAIIKAKESAEAANTAKTTFLANMSHEIRTPMGVIIGFCELLQYPDITAEEREDYLKRIIKNTKGLTRIIDDILDLAKVEAGKLEIEKMEFSLNNLLHEVIELFKDRAKEKNIYLHLQFETTVPKLIYSDPVRLRQILINLIGNAIKFTTDGGVTVVAQWINEKKAKPKLEIRVRDTGIGLSKSQVEKIFQPFIQADGSTSRLFGGTGLGLVISRRLAVALGGNIYIENSAEHAGCTFVITLFEVSKGRSSVNTRSLAGSTSLVDAPSPVKGLRLKDLTILIAEDSKDNQTFLSRILTKNGASLEIANDGEEAIAKALQGSFDMVLMDVQMPRVNGLEATRALRKAGYQKPIIALTAHAMAEERIRTKEAGCNRHLTKPVNITELLATIENHMHLIP